MNHPDFWSFKIIQDNIKCAQITIEEASGPMDKKNAKNNVGKSSKDYFMDGYNCSESTLLGISEAIGEKCKFIPQIASGFGGGFGRHGEICGAISGSVMAIGLIHGRKDPKDSAAKEKIYMIVDEYLKKFIEKYGTLSCRELTGCDMLTPEGLNKIKDGKIHKNICAPIVEFAEREALKIINEKVISNKK
jgi:C_GCAxxG_C_C family probable redox protein